MRITSCRPRSAGARYRSWRPSATPWVPMARSSSRCTAGSRPRSRSASPGTSRRSAPAGSRSPCLPRTSRRSPKWRTASKSPSPAASASTPATSSASSSSSRPPTSFSPTSRCPAASSRRASSRRGPSRTTCSSPRTTSAARSRPRRACISPRSRRTSRSWSTSMTSRSRSSRPRRPATPTCARARLRFRAVRVSASRSTETSSASIRAARSTSICSKRSGICGKPHAPVRRHEQPRHPRRPSPDRATARGQARARHRRGHGHRRGHRARARAARRRRRGALRPQRGRRAAARGGWPRRRRRRACSPGRPHRGRGVPAHRRCRGRRARWLGRAREQRRHHAHARVPEDRGGGVRRALRPQHARLFLHLAARRRAHDQARRGRDREHLVDPRFRRLSGTRRVRGDEGGDQPVRACTRGGARAAKDPRERRRSRTDRGAALFRHPRLPQWRRRGARARRAYRPSPRCRARGRVPGLASGLLHHRPGAVCRRRHHRADGTALGRGRAPMSEIESLGRRFPANFLFGAATAAYQIEGAYDADGKGPSIWDTFTRVPGAISTGETGDVACDHYHRWREDVALIHSLGLNAYRFSVSWPRLIPDGTGAVNERGLEFYERLVEALLERGIRPFVTLYHWDLPERLQGRGGWANPDAPKWFGEYARVVATRLGDRVEDWMTLNEPEVVAFAGHASGVHAPGVKDWRTALRVSHHLLLAHREGARSLPAAHATNVGIALNMGPAHAASASAADRAAAKRIDGHLNRWFLDPLFGRGYPDDMLEWYGRELFPYRLDEYDGDLDFVGVNYYTRRVVRAADGGPLKAETIQPESSAYTDMPWEIYPDAFREQS